MRTVNVVCGILAFAGVAVGAMAFWNPLGSGWSVGREVPPSERVPIDAIRHDAWDRLLHAYVDGAGRVDYARWKADGTEPLDDYLAELSRADLEADAGLESTLAYWINAYNALTIRGILREYPTDSIRNHTSAIGGYNIWKDLTLRVGGENVTLDEIEHQKLRPLDEPRIHFAIVCASNSCPRLLNEAYTADAISSQLDSNAREFFSHGENFRFTDSGDDRQTLVLSPILDWFGADFGVTIPERLERIADYVPADQREKLLDAGVELEFDEYDWRLNDRATPPQRGEDTSGDADQSSADETDEADSDDGRRSGAKLVL